VLHFRGMMRAIMERRKAGGSRFRLTGHFSIRPPDGAARAKVVPCRKNESFKSPSKIFWQALPQLPHA